MLEIRRQITFSLIIMGLGFQISCADAPATSVGPTPLPTTAPSSESYEEFAREKTSSQLKPATSAPASASRAAPKDARRQNEMLSRFFLVEQSSAAVSKTLLEAFRNDPPGGIVFWNSSRVGAAALSRTVSQYSKVLKNSGHDPAFFSIDYEGGGLTFAPSGRAIPGIQRFRQGFTDLAHGVWLGKSMSKFGVELCSLHGRIMGIELSAVGVNYPLTLVADLAQRLFAVRGISSDPQKVAKCMSTFVDSMASAGPVVAVTKHYPGLGQNSGDTHDVESVSVATTQSETEKHLRPFRDLISFVNHRGFSERLSIMSSHGKFPLLDARNLTTESKTLLTDLLRDQMQFQGVRVSDAMWMGGYGNLQGDDLYAVYANAFVSGMDMLMIPGSRYGGALRAFTQISSGQVSETFRLALEERTSVPFSEFQKLFLRRAVESRLRITRTLKSLPYPHETISLQEPRTLSVSERNRYYEILTQTDERWRSQLPSILP